MRCRARNVCADWRQEKCGSLKERSIHGTTASKHVERFITASPIAPLPPNNVQPCHPSIADPPSPPLRPRHMERTDSPHNLPSPCLTNAHPPLCQLALHCRGTRFGPCMPHCIPARRDGKNSRARHALESCRHSSTTSRTRRSAAKAYRLTKEFAACKLFR